MAVIFCCWNRHRRSRRTRWASSWKALYSFFTQSYHNLCLSSNNFCKKNALKLMAFVDKMNASCKARIHIGHGCIYFDQTASYMATYIEQTVYTEHTKGLRLLLLISYLYTVVLRCVAVLAIMCVCVCVDELNRIFESISTVVGDCGNNSCLKQIRHFVHAELWPIGGF